MFAPELRESIDVIVGSERNTKIRLPASGSELSVQSQRMPRIPM
jgi:hypothetical protein